MKFKKKTSVLETSFETETILLDAEQAVYFSIEGSGQWIWNFLGQESGQSISDISQGLFQEFEIPDFETAQNDVHSFLNELQERKLIEVTA